MAKVEINGKVIEAIPGQTTIIEVADQAGITIPRFCYHKKLSIAANCRMCLVEVEKAPKPVPACATPVSDGMKVWTRSPKALAAQKGVMEFLLINHPLDCPICDQGGECELQDVAMGYGQDISRFAEGKRVVKDQDLGPLIATDMTRCIHCTRCVRFGTEVAGLPEMGATGRGENMRIGTYLEQNVTSEVSGNMIDVCPVGALTSKPYRFTARGWELRQSFAVSPHDGLGSHLSVHTRGGRVMRVVPREAETINETWISDRDRFSYEALNSSQRVTQPLLKTATGEWQAVSWNVALEAVANRIQAVMSEHGAEALSALISPNSTTEECYLLQRLWRHLGSHALEHRLRQQDFRYQSQVIQYPSLGIPIAELERQQAVLLVGCQIHSEQPILGLRLRKAALGDTRVFAIHPLKADWHFPLAGEIVTPAGDLVSSFAGVVKAIMDKTEEAIPAGAAAWLAHIKPSAEEIKTAESWLTPERTLIVLGALAISHPQYAVLTVLANLMAHLTGAKIAVLPTGANHAGAWLSGCLPHQLPAGKTHPGHTAHKSVAPKAVLLWGVEPESDCTLSEQTLKQLAQAACVVAAVAFRTPVLDEVAEIYLPIAPAYETAGTFVNMEGLWQTFAAAAAPQGEAKPGWKVLRVLSQLLEVPDSEFDTVEQVLAACRKELGEVRALLEDWDWWCPEEPLVPADTKHTAKDTLACVMPVPAYRTDAFVRQAAALQKTQASAEPVVCVHPKTAERLNLTSLQSVLVKSAQTAAKAPFAVELSANIPENSVQLPAGFAITSCFAPYERVVLERVKA